MLILGKDKHVAIRSCVCLLKIRATFRIHTLYYNFMLHAQAHKIWGANEPRAAPPSERPLALSPIKVAAGAAWNISPLISGAHTLQSLYTESAC